MKHSLLQEYEFYKKLDEEITKQDEILTNLVSKMFEDFYGVSNLYALQNILVDQMDERISVMYGVENCDLFSYFIYEASTMENGGRIVTESGKEYVIKTFNDLLDYLESEYNQ